MLSIPKTTIAASLLLTFLCTVGAPEAWAKRGARSKKSHWAQVEKKLRAEKFSPDFIAEIKSSFQNEKHDQVLRLNTLGFLRNVDHQILVTDEALKSSRAFLAEHRTSFQQATTAFGVDAEIIAALLWVETKHGSVRGKFYVPGVYASLASADSKASRAFLIKEARKARLPASMSHREVREKIMQRTTKKAAWALTELRSVERQFQKNKSWITNLYGSFAGAFGIPQFIPSSYERHAYTDRESSPPDLSATHDAVLSVGRYLANHGWGADVESQKKALYAYNNSEDYVAAIMRISEMLKKGSVTAGI